MEKTTFIIRKMDCPSEEAMIRMKLEGVQNIVKLEFDIPNRKLFVIHNKGIEKIEKLIFDLNLGGERGTTENISQIDLSETTNQKKLLVTVLLINFLFFIIEMTTGLFSNSMGLVADSLDMLADSFVYAISLFAVGSSILRKKKVALLAGYFQIFLAALGLIEVLRRTFISEQVPDFKIMIGISILALIANWICLYLLQKSKSNEAHMQASMIFTSNDIIINFGVIVAGVLTLWLNSILPDLFIGTIVFILVVKGALRILKLGK